MRTFCYTLLALGLLAVVLLADLMLDSAKDRENWGQFGTIAIIYVAFLLWHDRRRTDDD